jgi:hypothetical protein
MGFRDVGEFKDAVALKAEEIGQIPHCMNCILSLLLSPLQV